MAEFGKMQELPFWKGKSFEEVSREELEARSIKRAEEQDAKTERLSQIQEEKSDVFVPPSEAAASATQEKPAAKAADMTGRGIDSLTRMEDRELVERATSYVEDLFEQYRPYMIWVFLATAAIWSIVMGVFFAIAHKNEDKEKARKMIVNYFIGLVVIFAILVACPYLIRGIAALVT